MAWDGGGETTWAQLGVGASTASNTPATQTLRSPEEECIVLTPLAVDLILGLELAGETVFTGETLDGSMGSGLRRRPGALPLECTRRGPRQG